MIENIIKKAIKAGYRGLHRSKLTKAWIGNYGYTLNSEVTENQVVMDGLFWDFLGKACQWKKRWAVFDTQGRPRYVSEARYHSYKFHELNLVKGRDEAIKYLIEVTRDKKKLQT